MKPIEVDTLQIQVIVDNTTDSLSSVPKNVVHEMDYLESHGMKELSGECLCCGAHGLSLLLTASKGSANHTLLFDAGPEGDIFQRNMSKLKINPARIEEIVLSHGHWDHAGGFLKALQLIKTRNPQQDVVFQLNPGMFYRRAVKIKDHLHPFQNIPSVNGVWGAMEQSSHLRII